MRHFKSFMTLITLLTILSIVVNVSAIDGEHGFPIQDLTNIRGQGFVGYNNTDAILQLSAFVNDSPSNITLARVILTYNNTQENTTLDLNFVNDCWTVLTGIGETNEDRFVFYKYEVNISGDLFILGGMYIFVPCRVNEQIFSVPDETTTEIVEGVVIGTGIVIPSTIAFLARKRIKNLIFRPRTVPENLKIDEEE